MPRLLALTLLLIATVTQAAQPPKVTNLRLSADESQVTLQYDVTGARGGSVEILVDVSMDGGRSWQRAKGLSGAHGQGVRSGRGLKITWDPYQTIMGYRGRLDFRVQTVAEHDKAIAAAREALQHEQEKLKRLRRQRAGEEEQRLARMRAKRAIDAQRARAADRKVKLAAGVPVSFEPAMVSIGGGCFQMGSLYNEHGRGGGQEQQHQVCVDAFKIGKYEVTQSQWQAVMGNNPSKFSGCAKCPVEQVSHQDIQEYLRKLNSRTGMRYRLPTEAEWEYSARAGSTTPFYTGNCITTRQANYRGTNDYNSCGAKTGVYLKKTMPVGSYPANPWGLHDMAGNVWEWTCSEYDKAYGGAEKRCTSSARRFVVRGGSWHNWPQRLRSAARLVSGTLMSRGYSSGFRLVQD